MVKQAEKSRPNLLDFTLEEMEDFIAGLGKEKFRARQIMKWLHQKNASSFEEMTSLSLDFRDNLARISRIHRPQIEKIQASQDGTKKALLRLEDSLFIESVLIPGKNHWTICISTQVGCAMGCKFCLTARRGLKRNLSPAEIVGQLSVLKAKTPEGPDIKNIVMMGMGEPLANYANTLKAIKILTSDFGAAFSNRKVTVSTCGLAPEIKKLGKDICINLAVSLNAADDPTRDRLMPVNKKFPLVKLLDACRKYPMPGRRMLTFEYILIDSVNSSAQDAQKLAALLKNQRCKINLIVFNEFPGAAFKAPPPQDVHTFQRLLIEKHFTTILRAGRGTDIRAACGQLSGDYN